MGWQLTKTTLKAYLPSVEHHLDDLEVSGVDGAHVDHLHLGVLGQALVPLIRLRRVRCLKGAQRPEMVRDGHMRFRFPFLLI